MDIIPLEAIRLWLLANCDALFVDTGQDSYAAGGIYGPPGFPKPAIAAMPRRAIIFFQSGSIVNLDLYIDQVLLAFRCYGETPYYADAVFRALDNCLHRQTCLSTGTSPNRVIGYTSFRASGPTDVKEPDTEWPCVFASYRVRYWEELT